MPAVLFWLGVGGIFYLIFKGTAPTEKRPAIARGGPREMPRLLEGSESEKEGQGQETASLGEAPEPEQARLVAPKEPPPRNPFRKKESGFEPSFDDIIGAEEEESEEEEEI